MKKGLAYILTIIHYLVFSFLLLIFHPVQIIAHTIFGYTAHKKTVDLLNFFLIQNLYTLICRPSFYGFDKIPKNRPLIIVANHQSFFDIAPVVWGFRKHHAKFISKKELGRFLPSISFNLRKGGSVLIDRKKGSQSIKEIFKLGKLMELKNFSTCLFPEGTRSRTGVVGHFHPAGFKTLLKASPSALIVPFAIHGNYKLHKYHDFFPLNIGQHLKYSALESIDRNDYTDEDLLERVEYRIKEVLEQS
jgi:1-acyl-sn-glycerol-3-phosphate acyltransferase